MHGDSRTLRSGEYTEQYMAEHKRQHFVPRSYLKAWCDPNTPDGQEPYVWVFSKDGSNPRRRAPGNLFHETDLYTIELPGGVRNLVLEHGLSQLESAFVSIRDAELDLQQPLTGDDHAWLCAFIAAAHARTPAQRDHQKQQWGKVLNVADKMKEWARTATPDQKRVAARMASLNRGPSFTYDAVKAFAEKPLQASMIAMIDAATPLLLPLDLAVFTCPEGTLGFITSDNPCVWFDADACKRPPLYQSPALMYESIEITLPISPRQIVLLNRRDLCGYFGAPEKLVDELNRRTRYNCIDHFVSNTSTIRPVWFDSGVEPEDSWRRRQSKPPN